jgi:uncharacterized protein YbjT (DUF2867 family)
MILVTGASGNVGTQVVAQLQALFVDYRVGERPDNLDGANKRAVAFDFLDSRTFEAAVAGVDAVFLLRPPAISNTKATLNVFIDVARRAGVTQFVFISVAGAGKYPFIPHYAVERHLMEGLLDWTILQPGFFAQNLGDAYRHDITSQNRIYVPAGRARVAFVDARDIAAVAVLALTNTPKHQGKIYTLTGEQAFSFREVAAMLSAELGRTITYHPASVLGYVRHLLARKMPLAFALVQTILHVGLRFGQAETVDATLSQLLAQPPTSLQDYINANRSLWAPEMHWRSGRYRIGAAIHDPSV